ncbi:MAG TPA: DUF4870 domain-containing protein [Vicinamibacterales bacterium]|nr:DUF4870 domain-containing protein [Vicinamibacterales bacterium]
MNGTTIITIAPEDRGSAVLTHLSGLSGYIVPFGGVLVPIIIWITRKEQPLIAAIAKQAVFLNLGVFIAFLVSAILLMTVILIPFIFLFWCVLGLAAIGLPIYGALKANGGEYYKYPVVGSNP